MWTAPPWSSEGLHPPPIGSSIPRQRKAPRLSGFIDIFLYFMGTVSRTSSGHFRYHKSRKRSPGARKSLSGGSRGEHFYPGFFCGRIMKKKNPDSLPEGCTTWAKSLIARTQKPRTKAEEAVSTHRKNVHLISDRKNSTSNAIFRRLEETHRKIKMK